MKPAKTRQTNKLKSQSLALRGNLTVKGSRNLAVHEMGALLQKVAKSSSALAALEHSRQGCSRQRAVDWKALTSQKEHDQKLLRTTTYSLVQARTDALHVTWHEAILKTTNNKWKSRQMTQSKQPRKLWALAFDQKSHKRSRKPWNVNTYNHYYICRKNTLGMAWPYSRLGLPGFGAMSSASQRMGRLEADI